jgi:hypothetical protein
MWEEQVDAISDTLMQRCGTFCTADDVVLCKAIEAIRRAKDATNQPERLDSLRESLRSVLHLLCEGVRTYVGCRLFTRATKHVTLERLSQVCAEYTDMHYFLGPSLLPHLACDTDECVRRYRRLVPRLRSILGPNRPSRLLLARRHSSQRYAVR